MQIVEHGREAVKERKTVETRTRINTAAVAVEPSAVRVALGRDHAAPGVARLERGAVRPADDVARDPERGAARGRDRAPVVRVDRRLVIRVRVHALDDVDLAARGPVRAVAPERGPRRAPGRHVHRVEHDERAGVRRGRRDAHRLAVPGHLARRLDAHDRVPVGVDVNEVRGVLPLGCQAKACAHE